MLAPRASTPLDCAVDAMHKGGHNPGKVIDAYVGGMGSKVSDKFSNVLATATGFTQAEIQIYVDKIEEPIAEKIAGILEKRFKKKSKKLIKTAVKKVLKRIWPNL